MAIAMGSVYLLSVGLKPIANDFGWPREIPSLAYSLQLIGTGFGGIAMGRWLDRAGLGGPVLAGALAIGIGSMLTARIDAAWQLHLINAVLIGFIGNGAMFTPLVTNTTRWFDKRRGLAVAIVASGQSVAGAIWPPVFRVAVDEIGWRAAYAWYGVGSLIVMLPLILLVRRRAPAVSAERLMAALDRVALPGGAIRHAPHALLSTGILTCCIAMAMPLVHIVAHVSDLGFGAKRGAELLSVILALSFFSRIAIGALADRAGAFVSLMAASALQALGLLGYVFAEGEVALFLASVVFGLGFGGLIPCYAVGVRALYPPEDAGWRIGIVFFAGSIGMALGGWMAGVLYDTYGSYEPAFAASVAVNVLNLAVLGVLWLMARRLVVPARAPA
jgi:MFS family permease